MNDNNSRRNWLVCFAMKLLNIPVQIVLYYDVVNLQQVLRLYYDELGEEKFWRLMLDQFRENEKTGRCTTVKVPNCYFPFFVKLFDASMERASREVMHERPAKRAKA